MTVGNVKVNQFFGMDGKKFQKIGMTSMIEFDENDRRKNVLSIDPHDEVDWVKDINIVITDRNREVNYNGENLIMNKYYCLNCDSSIVSEIGLKYCPKCSYGGEVIDGSM